MISEHIPELCNPGELVKVGLQGNFLIDRVAARVLPYFLLYLKCLTELLVNGWQQVAQGVLAVWPARDGAAETKGQKIQGSFEHYTCVGTYPLRVRRAFLRQLAQPFTIWDAPYQRKAVLSRPR